MRLYRWLHNKYLDWRYGEYQVISERLYGNQDDVTVYPECGFRIVMRVIGRPGLPQSWHDDGPVTILDEPFPDGVHYTISYPYNEPEATND